MVPYRGTGPAMIDLVAGQIDVLCDQATTAVPQIQGGTVKAYAVTSTERLDSIKDVPSAKEAGLPEFSVTIWNGLYAPKGVPKEVVDKVNAAIGKMVTDPTVLERFAATGTHAVPGRHALARRAREVPDGRVRALRGHVQGGRRDAAGGEVAAPYDAPSALPYSRVTARQSFATRRSRITRHPEPSPIAVSRICRMRAVLDPG